MNNRLEEALLELYTDLGCSAPTRMVIHNWAKRNFEVYSNEFQITKYYTNDPKIKDHMQKSVFHQLASKIGEDCGITEKHEPNPNLKQDNYVDKYRTTMWVLKKKFSV